MKFKNKINGFKTYKFELENIKSFFNRISDDQENSLYLNWLNIEIMREFQSSELTMDMWGKLELVYEWYFKEKSKLNKKMISTKNVSINRIYCNFSRVNLINAFLKQYKRDRVKLIEFEDKNDLGKIVFDHFEFKDMSKNISVNKYLFPENASKIKWKYLLPLLAYFIDELINEKLISVSLSYKNSLLRKHFCKTNGDDFSMQLVSGAFKKYGDNKRDTGKPINFLYVDDFITYLKE